MKVRVLKAFRYAKDGVNAEVLNVGDVVEISDLPAPGLIAEGWCEKWWPEEGEPRPQVKAIHSAAENKAILHAAENKRRK